MTKKPDPHDLVFLLTQPGPNQDGVTTTAIVLRHIAALLDGLRAVAGRVLDDVLALVLDSAIEVSGAERGFIVLANAHTGELEFKVARGRRKQTLSVSQLAWSRNIPERVFRIGGSMMVTDLLCGDFASELQPGTFALGIRHVLCVPLKLVRYADPSDAPAPEEKRIGVLYLDSREQGSFLSNSTRNAVETLAKEAAVAIENARLYGETMEKAKMEPEK